jgi:hypothetical protein
VLHVDICRSAWGNAIFLFYQEKSIVMNGAINFRNRCCEAVCRFHINLKFKRLLKNQAPRLGRPLFQLAAAAVVVAAAAATVVVEGVVVATAAAVAEQQDQNDDPPPVVVQAAADTIIVTHKNTSKNFVEL